ncbi:MAG TPA: zinc-dependent alcohol dehydrogenase [Blastocatellia bacterium]|nr:zinc-dependent alcohol dehydrogenase [Blastocatellia bacterium]
MKAAVIHEYNEPLRIEDARKPVPGSDEVLIKVAACGVCHSDLHIAEGDWTPILKRIKKPLIPGHEVVGRVVEKGNEVTGIDIGDRVGVAWVHWSCGKCEMCTEGRENLCTAQIITGAMVDGGYAEFIKARGTHATRVPPELTDEQAAPLFCAGVTVYRAIKNAGVQPGDRVAIIGVGGLGHLAVQIASAFGGDVIAVDLNDEKLEFARSLGANRTINAAKQDALREIRAMGGVHTAVVTSGAKAAYDLAFYAVRASGTLVVVGMPAENLSFPAISWREVKIVASATGTRQDLREVLELAASGKIHCQVETRPLEEINEIFDQMREAQIMGRVVVIP